MKKCLKLVIAGLCLTAFLVGPGIVSVEAACVTPKPCLERP